MLAKCFCSLMKSISLQDRAPAWSCPTEKLREGGVRTRWGLHTTKEYRTRSPLLQEGVLPTGDPCSPYATWKFHLVQDRARVHHPPHPSPPDRDSARGYENCLAGARAEYLSTGAVQRGFIYRYSTYSEKAVKHPQRLWKLKRWSFPYQTLPRNKQSHRHTCTSVGKGRTQRPSPSPKEASWNIPR